jgi:hypothetical protein
MKVYLAAVITWFANGAPAGAGSGIQRLDLRNAIQVLRWSGMVEGDLGLINVVTRRHLGQIVRGTGKHDSHVILARSVDGGPLHVDPG